MKTTRLALVIACVASLAYADAPSATGKWQVHTSIAGNENDTSCTFAQKQAELTGTCDKADGGKADVTGKVDGAKVTWSFKSEYNGTPLTVSFEGTLEAGKIAGSVTVPEYAVSGAFTALTAK